MRFNRVHAGIAVKNIVRAPRLFQREKPAVHSPCGRIRVLNMRCSIPVEFPPVDVAGIFCLQRVLVIGPVIDRCDFIAAVDHRNSRLEQQERVEHQVQLQASCNLLRIVLKAAALNAAHGGRRAAESGISGHGILIVKLAGTGAEVVFSEEIIVQEALVRHLLHALLLQEFKIQSPANVVVTANVVQKAVGLREPRNLVRLITQERYVSCRHCMPQRAHRGRIVEHVALGLLRCSEIRSQLLGLHHHLSQKENAGAHDLCDQPNHADNGVYLRKIPAVGAQLLPDVGNRVDADDVDSAVGKVQKIPCHLVEYDRVPVIQIPLIGIERGHHILAQLRKIGEIPRCRLGEHLRHGALKLRRQAVIVVEEIPVLVFSFSCPRTPCPLVLLGCVIHNEVQADTDSPAVAVLCQLRQILHRPQTRQYLSKIRNRVAAVAPALRRVQKGHEMQIIDAALLQIIQVTAHSLEISRKILGIEHHSDKVILHIPGGLCLALAVRGLQRLRPLVVERLHGSAEVVVILGLSMVELHVQPFQLIAAGSQPTLKISLPYMFLNAAFHSAACFHRWRLPKAPEKTSEQTAILHFIVCGI